MSEVSPPEGTGALARSGVALAAATLASGVFGYAYILILTRALGPERYGVLGTLLGLSVIATVAYIAIQLESTRAVAADPDAPRAWLHQRAALVSVGTGLVIALATPLLLSALRLPSAAAVFALAAMMVPQTYLGVQLGILLGAGRAGAFAVLLTASSLSRVAAAVLAAALDRGPTFVLWVSAATATLVLGLGVALLRRDPRGRGGAGGAASALRSDWSGMLRAGLGAGALLVLLNADLLAARSVLSGHDSGWYAFLTVFGRVTFWGTNFIALWVFPHEAGRGFAAKARTYALIAVAVCGAGACALAALAGGLITRLLAGPEYAGAAPYAPAFALVGSLMAVIQLATYVDVARARAVLGTLVWLGALVLVVAIRWLAPHTITGAVWSTVAVLAMVAAVGVATMRGGQSPVSLRLPES